MGVLDQVKRAWNAFRNEETSVGFFSGGSNLSSRGSRTRYRFANEKSIVTSVYTRIAIDVAAIDLKHIKTNDSGEFQDIIRSEMAMCFGFEPNIDQGPSAFMRDVVHTMFDNSGVAAIVPVDTVVNANTGQVEDIFTMRVGEITGWRPKHVKVSLWNEETGARQEILLEKRSVAIVENPLAPIMNEPNSTLQRLIRKLNLLDVVDEQSSSGKLDIIIQVPYAVKSGSRKLQAEQRRSDIEMQLKGSQYGIAYTDGTEKIIQLNRPSENNLLAQVEYLTEMVYSQLGITKEIMNGTADEAAMINYNHRTVEPIVDAIVEAMQRAFLGRLRTKQNEQIRYFKNPFKLVSAKDLAEVADKFSRNEILSPNEIRGFMGIPPSTDPKADKLQNSNMPQSPTDPTTDTNP